TSLIDQLTIELGWAHTIGNRTMCAITVHALLRAGETIRSISERTGIADYKLRRYERETDPRDYAGADAGALDADMKAVFDAYRASRAAAHAKTHAAAQLEAQIQLALQQFHPTSVAEIAGMNRATFYTAARYRTIQFGTSRPDKTTMAALTELVARLRAAADHASAEHAARHEMFADTALAAVAKYGSRRVVSDLTAIPARDIPSIPDGN
ncbi:MAG: hypothetical protein GX879_11740, partial [Bacteroidales bacterium]|nr:hypothetical protein [Bacteroidales bacterium]